MSLRVGPDGARLTVPPRTPASRIDAFLRAQAAWAAEQTARRAAPPAGLADGDRLAYLDGELALAVRPAGRRRPAAARDGGVLVVTSRDGEPAAPLVEAWYRREAAALIAPRAHAAAEHLGATVARVAVRDPRSRWGSCSSRGTLSFSWRLLLAPGHVLDYVVAHEACHLVRPDHSPAFWALLADQFPAHRESRDWLRDHGEKLHRGPAWRSEGPV
jgi:predicted metal-dependent hydrolase